MNRLSDAVQAPTYTYHAITRLTRPTSPCLSFHPTVCNAAPSAFITTTQSATGCLPGGVLSLWPEGVGMDLSRRDFLKSSGGAGLTGTALGSLTAVGASLAPIVAEAQQLRIRNAKAIPSLCPYCSVGCATLVHTIDGKIVNIEGDPRSPHNEGALCPKGAAIYQLHVNPNRPTKALHRAPGATEWEVWDLERAMNRVAELVKKTRDETFIERLENGKLVNMTPAIFSLGGATLDNEWNHVQQKLLRGLGVVAIENQARI